MWIAALLGDLHVNSSVAGMSPLSYMMLLGSKEYGTDIHTITANHVNIDRNQAKILNYARLYSCGLG